MSLIETINLHNVKKAAWRVARQDNKHVEFAFGIGEVLNTVAAQCRFVLVATEQAQVSRLCLPDWPLRAAQRRLTGDLPPNRSTWSLRYAASGHLRVN